MRSNKKIMLLFLFIFQVFFISGCWSVYELEDVAILTGASVDIITENGVDQYVTWSVVMRPPSQAAQSDQQPKDETSDLSLIGQGDTFQNSVMNKDIQVPRTPTFSHFIFFIFGEDFARKKTGELVESTLRIPGTRPNELFFVTKGEASKVLKALPVTVSALYIQFQNQVNIAEKSGVATGVTFKQFCEWLLSPDRDALLPEVKLIMGRKGESPVVEGFGVFRGEKLVGWLNRDEARGCLLMTRKLSGVQIPIKFTTENNQVVSYMIGGSKYKIKQTISNGKLSFSVKIQTVGVVTENNHYIITSESVKELEKAVSVKIKELPLQAIVKAKEYNSDFLGLMEYLHRHDPKAWREIQSYWRKSFQDADIEVQVDAKIVSGGMVNKAFHIKE